MEDKDLELKIEEVDNDSNEEAEKLEVLDTEIKDDNVENEEPVEELDIDKTEENDLENTKEELNVEKENKSEDEFKPDEAKNHSSKKLAIIIAILSVIFIVILVVCFSIFYSSDKTVVNKTEQGAEFELNYTDKNNVLTIENAQPVTDAVGISDLTGDNYFEFSVTTEIENATEASYIIAVEKNGKKCTILDKDIKIYLEKENSGSYEEVFKPHEFEKSEVEKDYNMDKGVMILNKETTKKDTVDNYRLKIWLADTGINSVGKNYSVKVKLYGYSK